MKTKLLLLLIFTSLVIGHSSLVIADDKVIRDQNGQIIARVGESANGKTVRDENGRIIGKVEDTANGKTVRDGDGKIVGKVEDHGNEKH